MQKKSRKMFHKNQFGGKNNYKVTFRGEEMLGMLFNNKEVKEMEYLLKRELEELLHDFEDKRIDRVVKHAMEERYQILYKMFTRIAPQTECMKYIRSKAVFRERESL